MISNAFASMCFVVGLCMSFSILIALCGGEQQQESSQSIDTLLQDRQFVKKQIGCVLGKNRCDEFGRNLRAAIPRVIDGNCKTCSASEAESAKKIITFVKSKYPDVWEKVLQKYSKKS